MPLSVVKVFSLSADLSRTFLSVVSCHFSKAFCVLFEPIYYEPPITKRILFKFPGNEFQIQRIHSAIRSFLLPHLIPAESRLLICWYGQGMNKTNMLCNVPANKDLRHVWRNVIKDAAPKKTLWLHSCQDF